MHLSIHLAERSMNGAHSATTSRAKPLELLCYVVISNKFSELNVGLEAIG